MFTVGSRPSSFRPCAPGGESPRGGHSPRKGDPHFGGQPPHKQRKRPPPLPTNTYRLTCGLLETYRRVNPAFVYVGAIQNPRRVLTKDPRPSGNHGLDNKSSDLILTVGDVLCAASGGHKFRVLDMLGQGTFGQVVKCRAEWESERDDSPALSYSPGTSPASSGGDEVRQFRKSPPLPQMVAVKIVKNKPAYFNQAKVEIKVLHKVSEELGLGRHPGDPGYSLIRLLYDFEYHHHLCLVFELMSVNLYELIKHQDFRGLPFARVRAFCEQLLDALDCLFKLGVIHCDLKPENILLENFGDPTTPRIKLIDLGSACYHDHVAFTYIQSRFYRAPEVLLGVKYSAPIDMWSLGCVAVELFMGLPVFPGVSAHNQLTRIVEMLGNPPNWMIEQGKKGDTYFAPLAPSRSEGSQSGGEMMEFDMREDYFTTSNTQSKWNDGSRGPGEEPNAKKHSSKSSPIPVNGGSSWMTSRYGKPMDEEPPKFRIKSPQEWAFENGLRDGPEKTKRYVKEKTLPGVILKCEPKRRPKNEPVENISQTDLECFIDFCSGLLRLDPNKRWTASQALRHPFIKQSRYEGPFDPEEFLESELAEEAEEDLLFGSSTIGVGDLATDMAEMEMEVDDDEEEEMEEEKRRVRTRAAPLAINRSAAGGLPPSSGEMAGTATSASAASSLTRKGLGLSSSQQQRFKRKLSESNSVAASPQTTASSLTSVLGSPITRPDVPYPLAHQSRWSDLGLLASPKLGPMGLSYHTMVPPPSGADQQLLASPSMSDNPGLPLQPSRGVSFGSSLPNSRGLFLGSQQGVALQPGQQDMQAFRRLEFQTGQPGSQQQQGNTYWSFAAQFPSLQLSPQQPVRSIHQSATFQQPTLALSLGESAPQVSHQLSGSSAALPTAPLPASSVTMGGGHLNTLSQAAASVMGSKLSASWTSPSSLLFGGDELVSTQQIVGKKRSESDHAIVTGAGEAAVHFGSQVPTVQTTNLGDTSTNAVNPLSPTLTSDVSNPVVVQKSLERWAPFEKDQQNRQAPASQSTQQQQQQEHQQ